MISLQFITGAAHGVLGAVLLLSCSGRLAACRNRFSACIRPGIDFLAAVVVLLQAWYALNLLLGIYALILGIAGLVYQLLSKDEPCNCFGSMSGVMEPYMAHLRLLMIVVGGIVACTQSLSDATSPYRIAGTVFALALGLVALSLASTRNLSTHTSVGPNMSLLTIETLRDDLIVGRSASGRSLHLRDLYGDEAAVVVLFRGEHCDICHPITVLCQSLAHRKLLPSPLWIINDEYSSIADENFIYDNDRVLLGMLGLIGTPTLVFLPSGRDSTMRSAQGVDAINSLLLELVASSEHGSETKSGVTLLEPAV
jgi:hypothetical protein